MVRTTQFNRLRNQSGFTLVELLVASGILGILVVGSMQYMQYQQRSVRTMEVKGDLTIVRNLVASWVENKQICDATFAGMSGTAGGNVATIFSQRDPANVVEFNLANQIPTTNWRVLNLDLLSQAEAQVVDANITGNIVNGIVTLLLRARVQQVRAGNVLINANEDRGNYASVTRDLFFPFRARVQELVLLESEPSPLAETAFWEANEATMVCANDTFTGGGGGTLLASLQALVPTATATNTTWLQADPSERFFVPQNTSTNVYIQPCWASTVNVPILECTPAGSSAGLN